MIQVVLVAGLKGKESWWLPFVLSYVPRYCKHVGSEAVANLSGTGKVLLLPSTNRIKDVVKQYFRIDEALEIDASQGVNHPLVSGILAFEHENELLHYLTVVGLCDGCFKFDLIPADRQQAQEWVHCHRRAIVHLTRKSTN